MKWHLVSMSAGGIATDSVEHSLSLYLPYFTIIVYLRMEILLPAIVD